MKVELGRIRRSYRRRLLSCCLERVIAVLADIPFVPMPDGSALWFPQEVEVLQRAGAALLEEQLEG